MKFDIKYIFFINVKFTYKIYPAGLITGDNLTFPKYINSLQDLPLVFRDTPSTKKESRRFLNLEPFIPFCKFANEWKNKDQKWGISFDSKAMFYNGTFCNLFQPGKDKQVDKSQFTIFTNERLLYCSKVKKII